MFLFFDVFRLDVLRFVCLFALPVLFVCAFACLFVLFAFC